ncbi:MAG: transposase [Bauldia sp.]|nr:transposase [Bauldia sp.]
MRYALTRRAALTRYRDDRRLEMDNNAAERTIRPLALGRKDHLFAGSDAGGECAAAICSPIESAKRNGLDPEGCLHHVLGRIADHPVRRVDELLPWAIAGENLIRAAARPAAGSSRKNVGKTAKRRHSRSGARGSVGISGCGERI